MMGIYQDIKDKISDVPI